MVAMCSGMMTKLMAIWGRVMRCATRMRLSGLRQTRGEGNGDHVEDGMFSRVNM